MAGMGAAFSGCCGVLTIGGTGTGCKGVSGGHAFPEKGAEKMKKISGYGVSPRPDPSIGYRCLPPPQTWSGASVGWALRFRGPGSSPGWSGVRTST